MSVLQKNQNFKAALWALAEIELAELPARETLSYTYSKHFLRGMQRILRAEKYGYLKLVNAKWKRTVAACITVCILLSGAMSVKAIREPVIEFIEYCYEEFTRFVFGENDSSELDVPETIETEYAPTYIPEGYTKTSSESHLQVSSITYENSNQEKIVFMQTIALNTERIFDTETEDYQKLMVDGLEIYYLVDDTHGHYQWIENNYLFSLEFTGNISQEEVLKIIDSLDEKIIDSL